MTALTRHAHSGRNGPLPQNRSSIVAVHSTWVSPTRIMHDPSACFVTPVSIETGRISLKSLPEGRIGVS